MHFEASSSSQPHPTRPSAINPMITPTTNLLAAISLERCKLIPNVQNETI